MKKEIFAAGHSLHIDMTRRAEAQGDTLTASQATFVVVQNLPWSWLSLKATCTNSESFVCFSRVPVVY